MTSMQVSTTNVRVTEFLEKTNFLLFNAYRVDLNVLLVYLKEEVLIVNDSYFLLTDLSRAKATCRVLREDYIRAFYFLEDSMKDNAKRLKENRGVCVVSLRKEYYSKDGIRQRLWFEIYDPARPSNWPIHNSILDVYSRSLAVPLSKPIGLEE